MPEVGLSFRVTREAGLSFQSKAMMPEVAHPCANRARIDGIDPDRGIFLQFISPYLHQGLDRPVGDRVRSPVGATLPARGCGAEQDGGGIGPAEQGQQRPGQQVGCSDVGLQGDGPFFGLQCAQRGEC